MARYGMIRLGMNGWDDSAGTGTMTGTVTVTVSDTNSDSGSNNYKN
jgi:hypothetical protein